MPNFKALLSDNILNFWMQEMPDRFNGGFYGKVDGHNKLHPEANKGAVLHARILWTFSAAYRLMGTPAYLDMANRAYEYIEQYFMDKAHGGIFWELDAKGNPVNTKKQTYAQAFALYAFAEYYQITQNEQALNLAKDLFHIIEQRKDVVNLGYYEAFTQNWEPIADMRLSEKDANEKKTMNTHLHVLEAYTNLLRIWPSDEVKNAQQTLIGIFANQIINQNNHHLQLFFEEDWTVKSTEISYGHDIEASWLLYEAALVLEDEKLLQKIKPLSILIAQAATEGIQEDGSLAYEKLGKHLDTERHWWVQAEALVGLMYAWKNTDDAHFKNQAQKIWQYIQDKIVDWENGEWYWSRFADGRINTKEDKAGFWKCPYHNGRMCMEMMQHFGS